MEKTVAVDGLKTRYLEEGSGPAVIMLHGASLGSSADVFERCLGPLARGGLRAIAYDQPGFGLTDTPADFTVSYRTAFILKFMDALKLDRAALLGHSQAGGMAARVALDHPARVTKLLVVACGSLLPPLPDQAKGGPAEGQEGGDQPPTLEDSRKLLESNLFNKSLATPEALQKRHAMSVGKNFESFVARSKAREPQKDSVPLWQRLKELSMPLLMLYGMQDRGSAAKRAALFKEKEPSLRIEVVDKAAHLFMWDAAEEFNHRAVRFLSA
jgi:pimeloyl-ACP methyl ester carboxylesterase